MPVQARSLRVWNMIVYSAMCWNDETMGKEMKQEKFTPDVRRNSPPHGESRVGWPVSVQSLYTRFL